MNAYNDDFDYAGSRAGYYPDFSRARRRAAEIEARKRGQHHGERVLDHAQLVREYGFAPCGAPGLLGGCRSAEEYNERRREGYPEPGKLP